MALVLEILLGVAILASFFVAYTSARTWPIYQVVLVEFLFLSTVAFFYLSARTLATHNAWRTVVNREKANFERLEADTKILQDGGPPNADGVVDPLGIRQLRQQLKKLAIDRGGVLYEVAVEAGENGALNLTLNSEGHGLVTGSIVFAFSEVPFQDGGRYLGEFKVVSVGEDATKVQMTSNLPLTDSQAQRLASVAGTTTLYTRMPIDDAALFAALDDATRQGLLPAASLQEYAGTERKLHAYEQFFHEHYVQQALLNDGIRKLTSNIARINAATEEAQKEVTYRQNEKTNVASDLEQFEHEKNAIANYQESLETGYRQALDSLRATYLANRQMAAALTESQLKAAEEIDRRSDAAAASGAPIGP
jgi:hypothetical protein